MSHHSVLWGGNRTELDGPELKVGDKAPSNFTVIGNDMKPVRGAELAGKPRVVLSAPSVDTKVCDLETRRFNEEASKLGNVEIVMVTRDLPFALKRWCAAAGVERVRTVSDYKDRDFGNVYGVAAPSKGLLARAVFVIDAKDTIRHVEYVNEVATEPNYTAALEAAKSL
jgi:thiol peroxidase